MVEELRSKRSNRPENARCVDRGDEALTVLGSPLVGAIEVRETDPADEPALRAWWEVGHAAEAERPLDLWTPWEVARRALPAPRPYARTVLLSAHEADRVVGAGSSTLRQGQHPPRRRLAVRRPGARGSRVGSAVLAALERRAGDEGRTTLISDAQCAGGDSAGSRFAARHGYAVASEDTVKAADLAATESTWAGLAAHAAERAEGYELVWWGDRAPEEHVEGIAVLFSRFLGEIPLGDLDLEPQTFDAERIRHGEERRVGSGVASLLVAAAASTGELVGYSNLSGAPGRAAGGRDRQHAGAARAPRAPAGPGPEGAGSTSCCGPSPRDRDARDGERRRQRAHERGQRRARLPRGRAGPRAPEGE